MTTLCLNPRTYVDLQSPVQFVHRIEKLNSSSKGFTAGARISETLSGLVYFHSNDAIKLQVYGFYGKDKKIRFIL